MDQQLKHVNWDSAKFCREKMKKAKVEQKPREEIDLLDTMLSSLVDLLIEKGIITEEEYEKRIKMKVKVK